MHLRNLSRLFQKKLKKKREMRELTPRFKEVHLTLNSSLNQGSGRSHPTNTTSRGAMQQNLNISSDTRSELTSYSQGSNHLQL